MKTWKSFQVTPWLKNDKSSRLKGENTKEFTKCTHQICEQFKILRDCSDCALFCDALYAYEKVHCFLSFVIIDDYETENVFLGQHFSQVTTTGKKLGPG